MIRNQRRSTFFFVSAVVAALALGSLSAGAQSLTAADITAEIDARGGITGIGSQIAFLSFTIQDKNGSVQESSFVSFGKTSADPQVADAGLIYFLAPPAETCGTVFLTIDRKVAEQSTELYLYLPALGMPKELVSSGERKGSFAGSNIQFDQMGRSELSANFNSELLGEAMLDVTVNGAVESRRVYVLHLTANPQTNPNETFPERTMWVDTEHTVGKLQSVLRVNALATFKDRLEYTQMTVSNVLDSSSTTVTVGDREDVGELPDSMFDPNALAQFDPRAWNGLLQVKVPDPICP
ncbi:MAG: outer membrane lipoprotein-sorting protein [Candidatus Bipolaricaulota bacterium]|nr:outer membrane lipoprotein-sorting protein [Candidatus Bipolaricaulota bacterium]